MAEQLTGGGRGLNSGAVVARIGARELGEVPGNGARLLHGSGKPGVWRSREATAAQGRSARRSCASATDLGFGGSGGGGGEVGFGGGPGTLLIGQRRPWRARLAWEIPPGKAA